MLRLTSVPLRRTSTLSRFAVRSFGILVAALVALYGGAFAQQSDPHYLAQRISGPTCQSAFIHGYLHGYEQGFHLADQDLQMGRSARDVSRTRQARDLSTYRPEFGSRHFFQSGYTQGFRVGYADGVAGRAFRAVSEIAQVGNSLEVHQPSEVFDQGFLSGYTSGQHQGLEDARRGGTAAVQAASCPAVRRFEKEHNPLEAEFCNAYTRGFAMGYSDGYVNQAKPAPSRAEAKAK